jgi:hypothetical protein
MKLREAIQRDLEAHRVFVELANRQTVNIWNAMRGAKDLPAFCGWYWLCGYREGGPFRTESAAMRDAWYRIVRKQEPPALYAAKQIWNYIKVKA